MFLLACYACSTAITVSGMTTSACVIALDSSPRCEGGVLIFAEKQGNFSNGVDSRTLSTVTEKSHSNCHNT